MWPGVHMGGFHGPDLQGVYVTSSYIQIAQNSVTWPYVA